MPDNYNLILEAKLCYTSFFTSSKHFCSRLNKPILDFRFFCKDFWSRGVFHESRHCREHLVWAIHLCQKHAAMKEMRSDTLPCAIILQMRGWI